MGVYVDRRPPGAMGRLVYVPSSRESNWGVDLRPKRLPRGILQLPRGSKDLYNIIGGTSGTRKTAGDLKELTQVDEERHWKAQNIWEHLRLRNSPGSQVGRTQETRRDDDDASPSKSWCEVLLFCGTGRLISRNSNTWTWSGRAQGTSGAAEGSRARVGGFPPGSTRLGLFWWEEWSILVGSLGRLANQVILCNPVAG